MWSGVFSLWESVSVARLAWIAASLLLFFVLPAQSFDYSKYKAVDLDELMDRPRPKVGVDIFNSQYYKVTGALAAYGEPCQTGMLKKGMMVGIAVTVHQTIVSHGSTTSRRPPALAFHLMAAFDFRRQLVLNVTHAEYDRIDALKL